MNKVFVTGMGLVSAIGLNKEENLFNLRNGISGIKKANFLNSKYADLYPFGAINFSDEELKSKLTLSKTEDASFTRVNLLSAIAIDEAIAESKIPLAVLKSSRTAFLSSSTIEGMCKTDHLHNVVNDKDHCYDYLHSFGEGTHTLKMVERYHFGGITDSINTACSSSANAIALGARLIKSGRADIAIVGGVDSMSKFTVNGFNALNILSDKLCKPFDKDRNGINLGEAGAYLVLESEESSKNKTRLAEVMGYGNSNDAFHPSSLSEEAIGVRLSIQEALDSANLLPEKIDYINAHGTSTENNDLVELTGMDKIFNSIPPYNSTKSYTGHTLAAAGSLEAIFSVFSITNRELYKSLNFENPIEGFSSKPISKPTNDIDVNYVLSNSFGFAGSCSSIVLGKA